MKQTLITAGIGVAIGIMISAVITFRPGADVNTDSSVWQSMGDSSQDPSTVDSEMIATLEARLSALESEMLSLRSTNASISSRRQLAQQQAIAEVIEEGDENREAEALEESAIDSLSASERRRLERSQRLAEAGFAADQVEQILAREREVQIANLHESWDRRRSAYIESPEAFDLLANNTLRRELGDQDYERYLDANGRATSVPVARLFEGSPASIAGLQTGDQIVGFDGQRVFNLRELNQVSVQGQKGETVMIEIERDGSRLQFAIERGPLGIGTRRGRRGF